MRMITYFIRARYQFFATVNCQQVPERVGMRKSAPFPSFGKFRLSVGKFNSESEIVFCLSYEIGLVLVEILHIYMPLQNMFFTPVVLPEISLQSTCPSVKSRVSTEVLKRATTSGPRAESKIQLQAYSIMSQRILRILPVFNATLSILPSITTTV